jgi:hypothetical protein
MVFSVMDVWNGLLLLTRIAERHAVAGLTFLSTASSVVHAAKFTIRRAHVWCFNGAYAT